MSKKQAEINTRQKERRKIDKERKANALKEYIPDYIETLKLKNVEKSARKRGIPFDLQEEDLLIPENCPILGTPLYTKGGYSPFVPSVDRINSSKGYVKGNVWIISLLANRMKSSATIEQLKKFGEWTQTL